MAHPERWRPHHCAAAPHAVSSRLLGLPTEAPAARREVLNHEAEAHVLEAAELVLAGLDARQSVLARVFLG